MNLAESHNDDKMHVKRKKAEEIARKNEALLKAMGTMAKVGGWELDVAAMSLTWTDEVYSIHEVEHDFTPTVEKAIDFYAPEARPVISQAVQEAITNGTPFDLELPLITAKGTQRFVHALGEARQSNGITKTVFGTFQDITERKLADNELKLAYLKLDAFWNVATLENADIKAICDHVLESITKMTDSKFGFYGFINEDETVMTIHSWSGEAMKGCSMVNKPTYFPVAQAGIWGEAIRQRTAIIINDYTAPHPAKKGLPAGHVPLSKLMVVPVFSSGKIISVAAVANRDTDYTVSDSKHLSAFAEAIQAIIDRKCMEETLRQKTALLEAQLNATIDGILIVDKNGKKIVQNRRTVELWKIPEHIADNPDDADQVQHAMHMTKNPDQFIERVRHLYDHPNEKTHDIVELTDGTYLERYSAPVIGDAGQNYGRIWTFHDITERRKIDDNLRNSQMLLQASIESPQGMIIMAVDKQYRYLCFNSVHKAAMHFAYSQDIEIGMNILDCITSDEDRAKAKANYDRAMAGESHSTVEVYGDENKAYYESFYNPIYDEKKEIIGITAFAMNITDRMHAQEALAQSEEKFAIAFRSSPQAISISTIADGRLIEVNDSYVNLLGYSREEIIGHTTIDLGIWINPNDRTSLVDVLKKDSSVRNAKISLRNKSGDVLTIMASLELISVAGKPHVLSTFYNITAETRMAEELQKSQKLEALGLLAGGIAHDFNNLLGGIYGYMDMANEIATDHKMHQYISKAMNTIDRGRHLTQQLLTFAKGGAPIKSVGYLFPHVRDVVQFALSGSNVSCTFDEPADLHACNFDKNQIAQVIDNIVINAKQSMPNGGRIEVSAQNVSFENGQHVSLKKGDFVRISIHDSGIGMPKEILPRIFDPFYTTKTAGHGLGLATSYSIINRHEGCIDVESEPGKGSTFHVFLPAMGDASGISEAKHLGKHKGSGTFIIMDDEEVMRETIASLLESFGYRAICAEDGREAVEILSTEIAAAKKVIALILDLTIPGGMGGREAISEIRKISTNIPVFVASGYADDPVMANPKEYGFSASICKPFRRSELAEMLNKYL